LVKLTKTSISLPSSIARILTVEELKFTIIYAIPKNTRKEDVKI